MEQHSDLHAAPWHKPLPLHLDTNVLMAG